MATDKNSTTRRVVRASNRYHFRLCFPISGGLTSSFETDFDGWTTSTFLRKIGSTPSTGTGPQSAADGSYYVYCETSSPNYPNAYFDMSKPVVAGSVSGLAFEYHMYGGTMGTAVLEAYDGTSWVSAWTQTGNLGNAWQQASVTVAGGATMLRFTCVPNDCGACRRAIRVTNPSPCFRLYQVYGGIKLHW